MCKQSVFVIQSGQKSRGVFMKRFFKILGICILSVLLFAYLSFLFVLPNAIDLNKYTHYVQDIVKEQANLDLELGNIKIITTPLLGAGVKVDNVSVKLPDGSLLFSADGIKTRISIPSILVLTAKVSCLEVENPLINLEIWLKIF